MVGNPISRIVTDAAGTHRSSYTYDSLYQLLSEEGELTHQYTYDALYNRTTKDAAPYRVNALNQVESAQGVDYTYDLDGNLTEKLENGERTTYKYDALCRLISSTKKGITTTYVYDAAHRRISKQAEGVMTCFLYEGDNEIGACKNGQLSELRLLGNTLGAEIGASVAIELEDQPYMPLQDTSGNLVQLTNLTTKATESTQFTAFGESIASLKCPWLYSSKRFDPETGFYYFGRRYFDSQVGRWITKDPLGFADGLNLYAYVHNQPLTYIDPDGQFAFLIPIALSMVAEYAVPFAAVALQDAGYIAAAAFVTGALEGYNGSYFEDTPLGELDPVSSNIGKVVGTLLSCANPRKACANVGKSMIAKKATTAATNVCKKRGSNWTKTAGKSAANEIKKETTQNLKPLTSKNARENLKRYTGITPDSKTQAHHVFPQRHKKFFGKKGINIHDPKYMTWWNSPDHQKNAFEYNEKWREFFRLDDGSSKSKILNFGKEMMSNYGFDVNY